MTFYFQVSYCDSVNYAEKLDLFQENSFLKLISNVVKNGITSSTYTKRADLITSRMNVVLEPLHYDVTLAKCDTTSGHVLSTMLNDCPTATEERLCSNEDCTRANKIYMHNLMFLTYQINNNNSIKELQTFLDERVTSEVKKCTDNCTSTITTHLSRMHLFIDILYLEGKINL